MRKRQDWEENYKLVQDHNKKFEKGEVLYKLKLNHLADLVSRIELGTYIPNLNCRRFISP